MNPNSFSATALQVAELCLARYKAEFIDYGRGMQSNAANVGIVCHGTLEDFLRGVYIRKDMVWDEKTFFGLFHENYSKVFGPDQSLPEYEDSHTLCYNWFHRDGLEAKFAARRILSLESKNNFPIETTAGVKPVNYIMDRLDKIGNTEYEVVDYKTNRVALTPEQLKNKIQARLYAVAVQIAFKDATSIWVTFDFLRHRPVSAEFSRADNIATWRMLQRATQRIVDTPDSRAPETLNPECGWCVRKADCKALQNNIAVGGIFSKDVNELAKKYNELDDLMNAHASLRDEIEMLLLQHAIANDTLDFETDDAVVQLTAKARRVPQHAAIAAILGRDLALDTAKFRVSDIDRLIKDGSVTREQAELLKVAMPPEVGDPKIKVAPK